jgi:hypothetical protein
MPLADTDAEYQALVDEEKRLELEIKKRALERKIKEKRKLAKKRGFWGMAAVGFKDLGKLASKELGKQANKKGKKE